MNLVSKWALLFVWIFSFSVGQAADLAQDRWLDFMTKNMPTAFCKSGQYYLDCYEVTKEECEDTASFAVETCIGKHIQTLPEFFSYEESRKWGAIIEKCVDEEYSRTFGNQKMDTPECKEIK